MRDLVFKWTRFNVCFLCCFVTHIRIKYPHISSIYEQPSFGSWARSLLIHVGHISRAKHCCDRDLCEHIACKWLQVCGQSVYLHRLLLETVELWGETRASPVTRRGRGTDTLRYHNILHTLSLGHERKRARPTSGRTVPEFGGQLEETRVATPRSERQNRPRP